ncbi:hypothetical protein ACU635_42080 [[Actinomadura] parvosata]|uniref:hypothetical protein n=1 Tax=[Actinomadura] parvosata TaxID=1955412 RepID=UPI00406BFBF1
MISFAVVLVLGGAGLLAWRQLAAGGDAASDGGQVDASSLEVLRKGRLTEQDVARVDRTALFYASWKATVTQPVMHITQASYTKRADFDRNRPDYVWESGYDYRTKEWQLAWGAGDADAPVSFCDNGRSFLYSYYLKKWSEGTQADTMCAPKRAYRYISDNLSTGGLTAEQADVWVRALRTDYKGLVDPGELKLTEVAGKQYLRLTVDFTPVRRADGLYYGGQLLMWSFKETKLDPQTHPYSYVGSMGTGYHAEYHLDPKTLLPAFAEIEETPAPGKDGRPRADAGFYAWRVRYHLPGRMPELRTSGKPDRPALDWPPEATVDGPPAPGQAATAAAASR